MMLPTMTTFYLEKLMDDTTKGELEEEDEKKRREDERWKVGQLLRFGGPKSVNL